MTTMFGPCVICGAVGYELSCGGPSICPKCDCGQFDAATVVAQAKVIERLRTALEVIAETANYLSDGAGVVGDLEKIARAALSPSERETP